MLDSIYHMTNNLKSHFWRKYLIILSLHVMFTTLLWIHNISRKIYKPLVVYRFYCMALFHSQMRYHMINFSQQVSSHVRVFSCVE